MELKNNLAQFFFDHSDVFMIAINSDEIVVDVNQKASEILGYSVEEIKGKNLFDTFVFAGKKEEARRIFHNTLEGNLRHVHFEFVKYSHFTQKLHGFSTPIRSVPTGRIRFSHRSFVRARKTLEYWNNGILDYSNKS